jgi:hypothetical protein
MMNERLTDVAPARAGRLPVILRAMLGGAAIVWILTACAIVLWATMDGPWPVSLAGAVYGTVVVSTLAGIIAGFGIGIIGVCGGILIWIRRG